MKNKSTKVSSRAKTKISPNVLSATEKVEVKVNHNVSINDNNLQVRKAAKVKNEKKDKKANTKNRPVKRKSIIMENLDNVKLMENVKNIDVAEVKKKTDRLMKLIIMYLIRCDRIIILLGIVFLLYGIVADLAKDVCKLQEGSMANIMNVCPSGRVIRPTLGE